MKTFALYNLKGGVGKTTSCINLAFLAAKEGHSTLVWDIDPQGALTYMFEKKAQIKGSVRKILHQEEDVLGVIKSTAYKKLDILPSDLRTRHLDVLLNDLAKPTKGFKKLIKSVKTKYNYVFIDCPPTLSWSAENVFQAADFILVPMIPSDLSEHAYLQLRDFFDHKGYDKRKLVPFFTLVDARKKIHKETIKSFRKEKRKALRSTIPYAANIERMAAEQAPIHHFAPKSKASFAYRNLWQELKWFRKLKPIRQ